MNFLIWSLQISSVPIIAPVCVGIIRKVKARLQNKKGASILQPYYDLRKLFNKDEIISRDASWISRFSPFIVFSTTIFIGAGVPVFFSFIENRLFGDFLVVIYSLAIATFFLALNGLDTGGAFGGFASSREMTISSLAEGGLIFSLLTVALLNGNSNLFEIASKNYGLGNYALIPLFLAFIGFFVVMLAENCRYPFDNPATHLELTMVREAMIIETSGKKLALMEWASANKLVIFIALGINLFFPFGIAKDMVASSIFFGIIFFLLKALIFCFAIGLIESVTAKFRLFRLPDLLIISFILNVVAISLAIL